MNKLRTYLLGFAAVVALTVLTACGGGSDNKGPILGGNDSSGSSSSSSGSSSGSGSGSSSGSSSGGTLDFAKAAKNLQDVKSFNFDVSLKMNLGDLGSGSSSGSNSSNGFDLSGIFALLGNVKATGSYVAPDQTSVTATLMGQQFSFIQIGSKSWTKQGNGKWTEGSSSSNPLGSISPTDLSSSASSIPPDALKNAKVTKDTVNGIKATRYSFDRKALEALSQAGGSSSSSADAFKDFDKAQIDVWISDDGLIPVKIAMDLSGKDDKKKDIGMQMEFNLKDVNSKSISIKPPI